MAELGESIGAFFDTILQSPVFLLLTVGGIALAILLVVVHHIHRIRSEEIFVHQAWGANWRGR